MRGYLSVSVGFVSRGRTRQGGDYDEVGSIKRGGSGGTGARRAVSTVVLRTTPAHEERVRVDGKVEYCPDRLHGGCDVRGRKHAKIEIVEGVDRAQGETGVTVCQASLSSSTQTIVFPWPCSINHLMLLCRRIPSNSKTNSPYRQSRNPCTSSSQLHES